MNINRWHICMYSHRTPLWTTTVLVLRVCETYEHQELLWSVTVCLYCSTPSQLSPVVCLVQMECAPNQISLVASTCNHYQAEVRRRSFLSCFGSLNFDPGSPGPTTKACLLCILSTVYHTMAYWSTTGTSVVRRYVRAVSPRGVIDLSYVKWQMIW